MRRLTESIEFIVEMDLLFDVSYGNIVLSGIKLQTLYTPTVLVLNSSYIE